MTSLPHRLALLGAVGLAGLPGLLPAQAAYRLSADTLRYAEVTRASMSLRLPQGPLLVNIRQDARIGVRAAGPDSATAWYDSLALVQEATGRPPAAPSTAALLRKPFSLRFTRAGQVTTRATPPVPATVAEVSDVIHQFDDFFISLPKGALTPGVTWVDTVETSRAARAGDRYGFRAVRTYRAARDTTVGGERAVFIEVSSQVVITSDIAVQGQPMRTKSTLRGTDTGAAVFAPASGRLLARRRSGKLAGESVVSGAPAPLSWPQTFEYQSSFALRR